MSKDTTRNEKSSYATKYPFGRGWVTESGHEFHWDDTPGAERIRIAHKSGTYSEISADGRVVEVNVGNKQEYHRSGVTVTVDHNHDIKIHGHQRVLVGGGSHIEVAGDAAITVGGDSLSVVGGNMKASVAGDSYLGIKGNHDMNVKGNMTMNISGDMAMNVKGSTSLNSQGNMYVASAADVRIQEPGTISAASIIDAQGSGSQSA